MRGHMGWLRTGVVVVGIVAPAPVLSETPEQRLEAALTRVGGEVKFTADTSNLPTVIVVPTPLNDQDKRRIGNEKALQKLDEAIKLDALRNLSVK